MVRTTQTQIKALRREIIELKLNQPYSSLIRLKNQELDKLIEESKA